MQTVTASRSARLTQMTQAPVALLTTDERSFQATVENFALCRELLAPRLGMPDADWWDLHCPDLRGEINAAKCDFSQAFSDDWSLQMDAALMDYATERAELHNKAFKVCDLTLPELIKADSEPPTPGQSVGSADAQAFNRTTSVIPRFAVASLNEAVPTASPQHLSDYRAEAIRARFMLLKRWNQIVEKSIPMINLQQENVESSDHLAHYLCRSKGRLLPDVKARLLNLAITLTAGPRGQPTINLQVGLPGDSKCTSAFEQLYAQLFNSDSLRGKDSQLWRVEPHGDGVGAFWTDGTDAGGHFRASVSKLCEDLCSTPSDEGSHPMFIPCPNAAFGDETEKFVPNPACVSESHLDRFKFLGQLMGASARTGTGFIELDLPSFVWKMLLRESAGVHELASVDSRTAAMLELATSADEETWVAATTEQPFVWCVRLVDGRVISLRGNGTETVAFADRGTYVEKTVSAWVAQFSAQIDALRSGLFAVLPELATRLLTWRELERRVCGHADVSVATLKRIAEFEGLAASDHEYVSWFWQILEGFTGEQRKQFLGFVWGRSRLPSSPTQRFRMDISGDSQSLPRSHTCMFQLHLPKYPSKDMLRDRLLLAVRSPYNANAIFSCRICV